jgi:hypothetical protein
MTKYLFSRRSLGLSGGIAVLLAGLAVSPALASSMPTTPVDTSACSAPQLSHPFLSAGDSNWYTLAPGESPDSFNGGGWTLSGGARIISTQLQHGQTGSVLDLPSGSTAVSPPMCVASDYPTARTMVRDVVGSEGVHTFVSYAGTKTAWKPQNTGQVHGNQSDWTLSNTINVHPGNLPGWQLVQFTLVPGGKSSEFQIYNFYVDPRMRG